MWLHKEASTLVASIKGFAIASFPFIPVLRKLSDGTEVSQETRCSATYRSMCLGGGGEKHDVDGVGDCSLELMRKEIRFKIAKCNFGNNTGVHVDAREQE